MSDQRNALGVPLTYKGWLWSKIIDAMVGAGSVAQGDILYRDATGWGRLAAGTSGHFLKTQGAAANPTWSSISAAAGGAMAFVTQQTVAGGPTTTLTVSGVNLDSDLRYFLFLGFDNALGSAVNIHLTYNADTTASNYHRQYEQRSGVTQAGTRANDYVFMQMPANTVALGYGYIFRAPGSGLVSAMCTGLSGETTGITTWSATHQWVTTATNVTSLVFTSSSATAIANDSFVRVFKIQT